MKQLKIKNEKENIEAFLNYISKYFSVKIHEKGLPTAKVLLHKGLINDEEGFFYDPYQDDYIDYFENSGEGYPILIKNSDNNFNKRPTLLKCNQKHIEMLTDLKIVESNFTPTYSSVSIESEKHYSMIRNFKKFSKNLTWLNTWKNLWIVPGYVTLESEDIRDILFYEDEDALCINLGKDEFYLPVDNLTFDYLDDETLIIREERLNCVIVKGDNKSLLEMVDTINLELDI